MFKESIDVWKSRSDLTKLQYAYALTVLVSLVLAGLIGLLNQEVAWMILSVTGIAATAFFVNLLAYSLVHLLLTSKAPTELGVKARQNSKK